MKANVKVKVEEEDQSDDFSREDSVTHIGDWLEQKVDVKNLTDRVRRFSRRFRSHPLIYNSNIMLMGNVTNRLPVNSAWSKLQLGLG